MSDKDRQKVIPREVWGASAESPARQITVRTDRFFVHHTVANAPGLFSKTRGVVRRAGVRAGLRAAERAEMRNLLAVAKSRGFVDISYSFIAMPSGRIYEGRGKGREGAHTLSWNDRYAVAAAGNYDVNKPKDSMIYGIRWLRRDYLKISDEAIRGHRDVYGTACPGQYLYARLDEV
jgi:hypothetical protein